MAIADKVRGEAENVERYAGERAAHCRLAARNWRRLNAVLGAPAAVAAGVTAGGLAVADQTAWAGSLAFVAAGLAALSAYLRSGQLGEALSRAASSYTALQNDTRLFREIESEGKKDEELVAAIRALESRRNEIDATTPQSDRWQLRFRTTPVVAAGALLAGGGGGFVLGDQLGGNGDGNGGGEVDVAVFALPQPSDGEREDEADLAARFAPVLRLSTNERFFPLDRRHFVGRADLIRKSPGAKAETITDFPRTVEALPVEKKCATDAPCRFFLHIPGTLLDVPKSERRSSPERFERIQQQFFPSGESALLYWHVVSYEGGETAVQYWLFYIFNNFQNWHEGDWEQITIRLNKDEDPIEAFYSSHEGGETRSWARVLRVGQHPVVYIARGSHANYFQPGKPRVPVRCAGSRLKRGACKVLSRVVHDKATGCGRLLQPGEMVSLTAAVTTACEKRRLKLQRPSLRYELQELSGPRYVGFYGFGNFLIDGQIPAGEEGPREPTIRDEWDNPLLAVVSGRTASQ